jgi:hypothetical protein
MTGAITPVDVDAGGDLDLAAGSGRRIDHDRRLEEWGTRGLRELGAELAEGEVLAALLDERERGSIPECGRSAVADDDLIAVGKAEELRQPGLHPADEVLDRCLAMGRPEDVRPRA